MNTVSPTDAIDSAESRVTQTHCAQLRQMLLSDQLEFLMEAHNGLSARIVREAGFRGIWASGLSISAQFGVRDNNEASWTQVVDMLEFMVDASNLPILLDGDTGYGNFNNMRRLVRKLEQRGVAGVCIEDKQFPKTNSFLNGERQPLAEIEEFVGKIKAGKDTQSDPNFSIVARVEALIAGWGMDEALHRAEAYRLAGADAILIHSKLSKPDEIVTFAREWAGRSPLVIVPTRYYSTPTDVFRQAGISTVIWANHSVRSAASAMQSVVKEIYQSQTLINVEDRIASVNEIFRLQDAAEYTAAEETYLSASNAPGAALVLAASRGARELEAITHDRPKVMLPIAGKPLLRWLVDGFKKEGINDITVVGGYRTEAIDNTGIKLVVNQRYATTGELVSLACAIDTFNGDVVISYGDLLFRHYVLRDLVESNAEFCVAVDSSQTVADNRTVRNFAYCTVKDDRGMFGQKVLLKHVTNGLTTVLSEDTLAQGRWIGLLNVRGKGLTKLKTVLTNLRRQPDFDTFGMPELLNALIAEGASIEVLYVHGHWRSVNDLSDFTNAQTPLKSIEDVSYEQEIDR
ncbi:phosphoenolpyruvate mutase [Candidatus Fukatsuia symbiotica]|uniref:phosphoenolpyruvate mutase n=1 Tax=Candidatus Fukatsuia symbiotica TaxID=1878942 RepID=A0A2U8I688_9GAMM|nr:phosphoenolpyruvate mutase [Candidatus Fukatsuia symbiotica]AWK13374.1 phosphoenolpyruvate mutase [Candidatus Fukatsuia symbiotica]MEA9444264.1 phosphoenolpyruvate mutase [Candidatus Fukatsuia symbiotica]